MLNLLWLLLPIVLGSAVLQWASRGRTRNKATEPRCGRCGYNVTGLPGTICPECGSDLREVGIIWPGARKSLPRWVRAFGWSVFVLLAVLLPLEGIGAMIAPRLPQIHDEQRTVDLSYPA